MSRTPKWWQFPQNFPAHLLRPGMIFGDNPTMRWLEGYTLLRVETTEVRLHYRDERGDDRHLDVGPETGVVVSGSTVAPPTNEELLDTLAALEAPDAYEKLLSMEAIEELIRRDFVARMPVLTQTGKMALAMARRRDEKQLDAEGT